MVDLGLPREVIVDRALLGPALSESPAGSELPHRTARQEGDVMCRWPSRVVLRSGEVVHTEVERSAGTPE